MPHDAGTGVLNVVVVAAADALEQTWIGELLGSREVRVLAVVGATGLALSHVRTRRPDVLLIDRAPEHAEALLRASAAGAPSTAGIVIMAEHSMAGVRRLVAAGARDILPKPLQREQLVAALRAAVQREREHPRRSADAAAASESAASAPAGPFVLLGSKGGVGTTTLAANLAVALRRVVGEAVGLVDLSQQFGDLGVLFNAMPRRTLHGQALAGVALDDAVLDRTLIRHSSGVALALAPENPATAGRLEDAHAAAMLEALRRRFSWLVVDCRSRLDGVAVATFQAAQTVLLVTTPDVLALRDARRAIEYLSGRGLGRECGAVVLNRCVPGAGPSAGEVEHFLRWPVRAVLPDAAAYTQAAERGVPLVCERPLPPEARRLLRLAAALAGDADRAELRIEN